MSILFQSLGLLAVAFLVVMFSRVPFHETIALALFIDAPFSGRADALRPPNPAKAPWYFVGIQEMVSHSAYVGGVLLPALMGLFLLVCPFLDRSRGTGGRWFARERLALNTVFVLIMVSQIVLIVLGQFFRAKNWAFVLPW